MASEKRRENEKEREVLKASRHFINDPTKSEKIPLQCLVWGFYSQTPFTNYQKKKQNNYYRGTILEEIQKVTKEVKKLTARNMNSDRL